MHVKHPGLPTEPIKIVCPPGFLSCQMYLMIEQPVFCYVIHVGGLVRFQSAKTGPPWEMCITTFIDSEIHVVLLRAIPEIEHSRRGLVNVI